MKRVDRALAILLLLRSGEAFSSRVLAKRLEVSQRTIFRDIELLASAGVPIYAEAGRAGGFKLVEGYFVPPVMFTEEEVLSLLAGLAFLNELRSAPFPAEREQASRKLLAVLPDHQRFGALRLQQAIAFEPLPADLLHPERDGLPTTEVSAMRHEGAIIGQTLHAIREGRLLHVRYRVPRRSLPIESLVAPHGVVWDRDRWYLFVSEQQRQSLRVLRADRVIELVDGDLAGTATLFNLAELRGRSWLRSAMERWTSEVPVVLRVRPEQAALLQKDWYYQHASFSSAGEEVRVCFGEDDPQVVFTLLRWLGPGAELLEPEAWRTAFAAELRSMLNDYS
jgi:predicted DNA-binding transcriptional regulator YafY